MTGEPVALARSGSMEHAPLEVLFATQGALGTAVMGWDRGERIPAGT